jgi:hypothetical protein
MKFAAIAAACLGLSAAAGASRLLDPVYLGAGSNPRGVASADLNGDGFADLAVADFGSGTLIGAPCPITGGAISIYNGSAQGLKPGQVITVTDAPRGLALVDLNNDGKPDLLATFYCNGNLAVFLNKGDGTFSATPTLYPTGIEPVGVAAQVSNGSGLVAVADYGSNKVSVYAVKMGVLTLASTLAVGANPTDVKFYPSPLGKSPVLFVADYGANAVTRLSLNSDGTQAGSADMPVPGQPCKLAVGDLNNDGLPDLAVARFTDSAVSVFLGQADGSVAVTPVAMTLAGRYPNGLALGRLGGAPSLVTADRDSDQIEVLHWSGQGLSRCAAVTVLDSAGNTGTYGPVDVAIADFNSDGYGDVAASHMRDGRVILLSGARPAAPAIASPSHPDPSGWSAETTLVANFTAAPDLDGISGWQAGLDQDPVGSPATDAAQFSVPAFTQAHLSAGDHYLHVRAVDANGKAGDVATYRVGIKAQLNPANTYNFPNPTRDGRTTIRFPLMTPAAVELKIYNETGDLVWHRDLSAGQTQAGLNLVIWEGQTDNGRNVANGGYILTVRSGSILVTKKIAVVR